MPFRVTIIPADNDKPMLMTGLNDEAYENSLYGDTYPTADGNNALTNTSVPAATVQVGLSGLMKKPITDIVYNEQTQTVSFDFMGGSADNVIASVRQPSVAVGESSYYTLDGKPINSPSRNGIYIMQSVDGTVRKVTVPR